MLDKMVKTAPAGSEVGIGAINRRSPRSMPRMTTCPKPPSSLPRRPSRTSKLQPAGGERREESQESGLSISGSISKKKPRTSGTFFICAA